MDSEKSTSKSCNTNRHKHDYVARLRTLYQAHAKHIINGLRRTFGDGPPEPEDITQIAFQKLIERGNLADIRDVRSFLWRTARNLTLNEKRAMQTRASYDFEIENLFFAQHRDEATPERLLHAKEQLQCIDEVLRQMPTRRRRSFLLHKVEALSIAETAKTLGISKSTAHREVVKAGIEIDVYLQMRAETPS
ncbi:MAG TPA: hypothetical protein DD979_14865 [Gammaproteobacteria bacterium]|jgi:RNA polymerase sigma-70 factor (ECF subfamily)|nr:hypothetical protein [Gammaproteobacteria bacterium]